MIPQVLRPPPGGCRPALGNSWLGRLQATQPLSTINDVPECPGRSLSNFLGGPEIKRSLPESL
jgi:hypothetical protein